MEGEPTMDLNPDTTERIVRELMLDFSIELTPREVFGAGDLRKYLPERTRVFLTALPGHGLGETLLAARQVSEAGLRPVPHIAAREVASLETLAGDLHELTGTAQVREVLLIAGGARTPRGPLADSIELLASDVVGDAGLERVYVAGYPEGSPVGSEAELLAALRSKVALAVKLGLELAVVTQFCFDGCRIASWIAAVRRAGIPTPVRAGLAGVTSLERLLRFAARCGVGPSAQVLRRESRQLLQLVRIRTPARTVLDLISAADRSVLDPLPAALHFYSLGAFEATARWCTLVREGAFEVVTRKGQPDLVVSDEER
jgi:methylenetetrahydrofolate reductase (NADPH)